MGDQKAPEITGGDQFTENALATTTAFPHCPSFIGLSD